MKSESSPTLIHNCIAWVSPRSRSHHHSYKRKMTHPLITLLTFLLLGCHMIPIESQETKPAFTLTIHLEGDYEGHLYLMRRDRDSVLVHDGKAIFRGHQEIPEQVAIILEGRSNVAWVFLENSDIEMFCRYIAATDETMPKIIVDSIKGSGLENGLNQWFKDYKALQADKKTAISPSERLYQLVSEKIGESKHLGAWILARITDQMTLGQCEALYTKLEGTPLPERESNMIQSGIARKKNVGSNLKTYWVTTQQDSINLGAIFRQSKKPFQLVHFWATWCRPCIKQIPKLLAWEQQNQHALEVISLSINEDKKTWLAYLNEHSQMTDSYHLPLGWDSDLCRDMNVKQIPFYMLIGSSSEVVAQGNLEDIEQYLAASQEIRR